MDNKNCQKVLAQTVMLKSKLPETYNRLFKFKKFPKFEEHIKLEYGETVFLKDLKLTNSHKSFEMLIATNNDGKPCQIHAYSLN
jgi:hypothetical protein